MNVNRYLNLKRICCRIHHLLQGFNPFLSDTQLAQLDYDLMKVAQLEEKRNLLTYIKIE